MEPRPQLTRLSTAALCRIPTRAETHACDLKPAKIRIKKSGVQVLDFGLARLGQDETLTASLGAESEVTPRDRQVERPSPYEMAVESSSALQRSEVRDEVIQCSAGHRLGGSHRTFS